MSKAVSTGLVEFETAAQAQAAKDNLNGIAFFGRSLVVNFSKHKHITIGKSDDSLTQDFTTSREHRYKKEGSKNTHNIAVSNLD